MKKIYLKNIRKDAEILLKYISNREYMSKLIKLNEIVKVLEIDNINCYNKYQLVLKQLKGYSYYEATFLRRIENAKYLEIVKKALFYMTNNQKNYGKTEIIQFKKR